MAGNSVDPKNSLVLVRAPRRRVIGQSATVRIQMVIFVLANALPVLLAYAGYAWPYAALVYCASNVVAILQASRRQGADTDHPSGDTLMPCLLMTAGALGWTWLTEPQATINGGLAWDGRQYAALYTYFSTGAFLPITPTFPYSQRIGLPFLAAHLPLMAPHAFLLLHGLFWSATMVMFAVCCRTGFQLKSSAIQLGVLWLQLLWFSIPRAVAGSAFAVDSAALFFIQSWVYVVVVNRRKAVLPVLAFLGVLFKETVLLIVLLFSCSLLIIRVAPRARRSLPVDWADLRGTPWRMLGIACLSGLAAKWIATHALPAAHLIRGSELDTMLGWISIRLQDPWQVLRYVAAALSVYGGFALLRLATLGKPAIRERGWPFTLAIVVCPLYFAICFVAGSDLTRFAFLAFPFALPLLLVEFDEVSTQFAVLALLLGLPAAHAFAPAPPPVADLPHQDLQGLYSWMMEYAHLAIVGSWLAWWLACTLLLRSVGFLGTWRSEFLPERPAS